MLSTIHLKINKTETITDIFARIKTEGANVEEIYLEIQDNAVFRNYINLRLLLSSFHGKKFSIITSDATIKKIGEPLGIRYYFKNDNIEFEKEYAKRHILKHNFTFLEYLLYEIRKFFGKLRFFVEKKQTQIYKKQSILGDSNVILLLLGLAASVSLLVFIFYFAVSRTYIYITPQMNIKTASKNLLFMEQTGTGLQSIADNVVTVQKVNTSVNIAQNFDVTTLDESSTKNAQGVLEIYNELPTVQVFRPNTRFLSQDGIVYRTKDWVSVPPMTETTTGSNAVTYVTVNVVADPYDINGKIVGTKGNIADGAILTIPGLKFNRDKIYGRTEGNFSGGENPTVHTLTDGELSNFKKVLTDELQQKALKTLQDNIAQQNHFSGQNYAILPINDTISYSPPSLSLSGASV